VTELQAGVLLLLIIPVVWFLFWWGWRRRTRRDTAMTAPLPAVPAEVGDPIFGPVEAIYVTTTHAGRALDRLAAHRLGVRSDADVGVHADGVMVARQGEPPLWVPAADLLDVHRQRGMVGKVADREGIVVITWRLGDQDVDTGLRPRYERDRQPLEAAVSTLLGQTASRNEETTND
jgi:hypothetical protein